MNGAESLVRTLVAAGVDTCFANPGTSEMHFVAALDRVDGMHCVLCLFEGVVTGAADGYGRMRDKPAATLLHLGPGLGNGLANLHNARKARTPLVNIVGEHATWHLGADAPLTSDVEGVARPMSDWVRTSKDAHLVAADGAAAVSAALSAPGQVATLILPADTAWNEGGPIAPLPRPTPPAKVDESAVTAATEAMRRGRSTVLFVGHLAGRATALELIGRATAHTGARLFGQTSMSRVERGAGRVALPRLPYPVDMGLDALADAETIVLVGAPPPVAFFGYPGKPSRLAPPGARIVTLARPEEDIADALARLVDRLGAGAVEPRRSALARPELPRGRLTPEVCGAVLGALLPEGAIVVDESITMGAVVGPATAKAPPHDWLQIVGGSIGIGPPLALGAAVACPDRKVVALQADGSGMYTPQALWSQARARADVLTIVWSNRSYAILEGELAKVGANPGRKALGMLSLRDPDIGWVDLARSMGVDGRSVATAEDFAAAMRDALAERGPFLIEVII
jgi:acetolactate synthase-1/2/3 large subunit